jgi:hypothetical protein
MNAKKDSIREGREGARTLPERERPHIPGNEFVFTSRFFAPFADTGL